MADSGQNLFNRLKRLFSTSVVVRDTDSGRLKIADPKAIQQTSITNQPGSKHLGLYAGSRRLGYEHSLAYFAQRTMLFKDYEAMDADPIIASALDIYADESTVKNEFGDILKVQSEDEEIRDILSNLYYDVMNIEFNLWPWIRGFCKYGDFFLQLEISEKYGITNVIPLSVYEARREENFDPNNPFRVRFIVDGPSSVHQELEFFQVAHFRNYKDSNFLPYGKSMIEAARRVWKQLALMEDAMLIHRIVRSPEKRVFSIDVGNIAPADVDAYMAKIIDQIKKVPLIDENTGEYNLRFNLENMLEDFYLPVRGGDSGTNIDTLGGLQFDSIDDIEYLRNKMMASLKIPKAFLGYEEELGGKATLAAEDVRFARTIERLQHIVVKELEKIGMIHLYSLGYTDEDMMNFELSLTNPSTIYEQEKLELWSSKISLARDIKDLRMLSSEWIYKNIFNISDDEIKEERLEVVKDVKRMFRHEQIEREGNDPAESGQAYDTGMGGGFGVGGQFESVDRELQNEGDENNDEESNEPKSLVPGELPHFNLTFEDDEIESKHKISIEDDLNEIEDEEFVDEPDEDDDEVDEFNTKRGSKSRTRKKDEPFGEDPLGQRDMRNVNKVDREMKRIFRGNSPLATSQSTRRNKRKRMASRLSSEMATKLRKRRDVLREDGSYKEYFLDENNILSDEEDDN